MNTNQALIFTFDNLSIIFAVISILSAVSLALLSPYMKKIKKEKPIEESSEVLPSISVVISAFDHTEMLMKKLKYFIDQKYNGKYEIIVVVNQEKAKDENYLYELGKFENVRMTFIPAESRYMGPRKLAVSLGVKSAKYDWVLLTDVHSIPAGDCWISTMARNCSDDCDFVLGYSIYKDSYHAYHRFERMLWQQYTLNQAEKNTAYSVADGNMLFRKSVFFKDKGYFGNWMYIYGEYEFLLNKYAQPGRTVVETHPEAWTLHDEYEYHHEWKLFHSCFQETRQHLLRKRCHNSRVITDQVALHLSILLCVGIIVFGILSGRILDIAIAGACLLVGICCRMAFSNPVLSRFETEISIFSALIYELTFPYHQLTNYLRYSFTDKTEFISHKF